MRILKVTQAYYPFSARGGPAIKVRAIARELVRLGHKVTVLTADLGFGAEEIAAAQAKSDAWGWRSELDGVETIYFKTRFRYRNLTTNPKLPDFCAQGLADFDVAHIYGLYDTLGPTVGRYCTHLKIPYVIEPLGMTRSIDRGFLLKGIWKRLKKRYLERAAKWVATSTLEMRDLAGEGVPDEKVVLRLNGIDQKDFSQLPAFGAFRNANGIAENDPVILFLGRLIPRKGADLLIDALPHVGNDQAKLVIAGPEGESGYLAFLRQKAKALGLEQRVLFLGPLYENAQKEAYVDATVFALPSRYENFGNTAAEAIACGTPVIVSNRCGIAPLVDQRAGLVTEYDSKAIAQTLRDLLSNPSLYQLLKAKCPEVAAEISWEGLVRQMERSYEEVRNGHLHVGTPA